jgi:5,10-methylenetetrahydrofolate reductase
MAFLRVVEVLPPLFPAARSRGEALATEAKMERFFEEVRSIRDFADVVLVANVKDQGRLKIDAVHAAAMLQENLRVEAAPVIVVRDQNRPQFLSSVLTAISIDLKSMMIAWGDDYPPSARATNVRDFANLSMAIHEASRLRSRARSSTRLFAPVDVDSLAYPKGVSLAKERLRAGADVLLAQPPTSDPDETFDRHASLIDRARLKGKVLLNVFPFKNEADVRHYERLFGWRLPKDLHTAAKEGEASLVRLERSVIRRLRLEGYPGVYLTTRGNPRLAETLLS